jgi:hypothetical protein
MYSNLTSDEKVLTVGFDDNLPECALDGFGRVEAVPNVEDRGEVSGSGGTEDVRQVVGGGLWMIVAQGSLRKAAVYRKTSSGVQVGMLSSSAREGLRCILLWNSRSLRYDPVVHVGFATREKWTVIASCSGHSQTQKT